MLYKSQCNQAPQAVCILIGLNEIKSVDPRGHGFFQTKQAFRAWFGANLEETLYRTALGLMEEVARTHLAALEADFQSVNRWIAGVYTTQRCTGCEGSQRR